MQVLVGCDPELFMFNPNSNEFVSAHHMVPGTKDNPYKVANGAIQVDGMALEFNIDPAATREEFVGNVQSVITQLGQQVPGYQLRPVPVAHFSQEILSQQPPEALELGCEPDWSAYTGEHNPRPDGSVPFRSGAGHIHIGWGSDFDTRSKNHFADCVTVVRQMDYYLGINSLLWDSDKTRRSLYGRAGAFRVKPYGVEYRTLSNAWVANPHLMGWVYDKTIQAVQDLSQGREMYKKHGNLAQRIIDNNEVDWSVFDVELPRYAA